MNSGERDRIVCQLLDPRTGQEIGACSMAELPAEIMKIVQAPDFTGDPPRVVFIDAQKTKGVLT